MMMVSKHHASSESFPDSGGGLGFGGDDDDIGTQTPRTISPQFRDGGPSYMMMVSKHHVSSVGFPDSGGGGGGGGVAGGVGGWGVGGRGVRGGGGMMTTLVHRHPEQISPQEPFYSVFTVLSY